MSQKSNSLDVDTYIRNERDLSEFIQDWIWVRYDNWDRLKREMIIDKGMRHHIDDWDTLNQTMINLVENCDEFFSIGSGRYLIPDNFSSIEQLLQTIEALNNMIQPAKGIIEANYKKDKNSFYLHAMTRVLTDWHYLSSRCMALYANNDRFPTIYERARFYLNNKNIDEFIVILKGIIAGIPYSIRKEEFKEAYFHIIVHTIMNLIGFWPESENSTNIGRIDMAIELENCIYIFEFKYDKKKSGAENALNQIYEKKYKEKFINKNKEIIGVGINFKKEEKNIKLDYKDSILYVPEI